MWRKRSVRIPLNTIIHMLVSYVYINFVKLTCHLWTNWHNHWLLRHPWMAPLSTTVIRRLNATRDVKMIMWRTTATAMPPAEMAINKRRMKRLRSYKAYVRKKRLATREMSTYPKKRGKRFIPPMRSCDTARKAWKTFCMMMQLSQYKYVCPFASRQLRHTSTKEA